MLASNRKLLFSIIGLSGLIVVIAFQNCSKSSPSSSSNTASSTTTGSSTAAGSSSGPTNGGLLGSGSTVGTNPSATPASPQLVDIYHGADKVKPDRVYTSNKNDLTNYNLVYIGFRVYSSSVLNEMIPLYQCLTTVNGVAHHHFLSNLENCERPIDHSTYDTVNTGLLGYLYKQYPSPTSVPQGKTIFTLTRCFYSADNIVFHMASIVPATECGNAGFLMNGTQKDGAILGYYIDNMP